MFSRLSAHSAKPAERGMNSSVRIRVARSSDELHTVRLLFQEFAEELAIDLGHQEFDAELRALPGRYAPPRGELLLAEANGRIVGCVGLRELDEQICEMKRLYVRPEGRTSGAGRALATAIVDEGKRRGYQRMRLDTLRRLKPALRMYLSMGFVRIEAYCENPEPDAEYLELTLV